MKERRTLLRKTSYSTHKIIEGRHKLIGKFCNGTICEILILRHRFSGRFLVLWREMFQVDI